MRITGFAAARIQVPDNNINREDEKGFYFIKTGKKSPHYYAIPLTKSEDADSLDLVHLTHPNQYVPITISRDGMDSERIYYARAKGTPNVGEFDFSPIQKEAVEISAAMDRLKSPDPAISKAAYKRLKTDRHKTHQWLPFRDIGEEKNFRDLVRD